MKTTELRIGNLVHHEGIVSNVFALDDEGINGVVNPNDGLEIQYIKATPIPLTEEWMERLGFRLDVRQPGQFDEQEVWTKDGIDFYEHSEGWSIFFNFSKTHVRYVHQLQNLFFSLVGEELTVKNPTSTPK